MGVGPPVAKPQAAHTIIWAVVLAIGLPFSGHQAAAPGDAICIPSHHWITHSSGSDLADAVLYAAYILPAHSSSTVDFTNIKSP